MMTWKVKSKDIRRKEYLLRVCEWHKKFLWRPQVISEQDGMRNWVWFQTVFRRAILRDLPYSAEFPNAQVIREWEYCTDEFEMIRRPTKPSKPRYLGLNGWDDTPGK